MEKERCHGCDKWFARIEQHLTYHNHCRSVMVEHARQQRLVVECRNRNNGMDPLIGTIVVASAREVDDGMSTGMSTRGAKRQRCFEQEDDNQSNITFEGMDDVDDFGPMIPSPSGEVDPMEADFIPEGPSLLFTNWKLLHTAVMVCLLLWQSRCLRQPVLHKHPTRQCN